jgi:uncharacterized protein (TIGR02118 family)
MIKLVTFLKRGGDLSRPGFETRWLTVHAPMAAVFPGLRGYMLGFSLDDGEPKADGVAQLWFDSREAAQASYGSDIGRRGSADASAHLSRREHLLASEVWLASDGPLSATPFKLMVGVKRAEGQHRDEFTRWLQREAAELPEICGTGQARVSLDEAGLLLNSKVAGSLDLLAGEAVFDGLIELWFRSAAEAGAARERFKHWAQHALTPHVSLTEDALLQEHVVVLPPAPAYGLDKGR